MLVGHEEVCAAPPALIAEAMRAFVDGCVTIKTAAPPLEKVIKDVEALFTFASARADQHLFLWLLTSMHKCVVYELVEAVQGQEKRQELATPDGLRRAIFESDPARRLDLLQGLAASLVSQAGLARRRLLEIFARAAGSICDPVAVDAGLHGVIRNRWPSMTNRAALRVARAVTRCLRFEAVALELLAVLESDLRAPLGQPLAERPVQLGLFDLAIGPSRTARLIADFDITTPSGPPRHAISCGRN
jgi:hypothetical protein